MGKTHNFKHREYQNLWTIIKFGRDEKAICLHFLTHLQKIWIFNFPR